MPKVESPEVVLQKKIRQMEKDLSAKRSLVRKLQKKESDLDASLETLLHQAIEHHQKEVDLARRSQSTTEKRLTQQLRKLELRKEQLGQKTELLSQLREQQGFVKEKIERVRAFLKETRLPEVPPSAKPLIQTPKKTVKKPVRVKVKTALKPAKPSKPAVPVVPTPVKPKKAAVVKPIVGVSSKTVVSKTDATPANDSFAELNAMPSAAKTRQTKSIADFEAELSSATGADKTGDTAAFEKPKKLPGKNDAWKTYSTAGFSFSYPNWPEHTVSSLEAALSIAKDGLRMELFVDEQRDWADLDKLVDVFLGTDSNIEIIERKRVNDLVFLVYNQHAVADVVMHFMMLAAQAPNLIRIDFFGSREKQKEYYDTVLETFKTFKRKY